VAEDGWIMTGRSTTGSSLDRARAAYRDISLYSPNRAPCRIDLSDNTNLFGVPPAARAVLANVVDSSVTRYPSLYSGELKEAIARTFGIRPENVVTGCGSDDVLDSAIRAFCEAGDVVATSDPSFAMIPLFAKMNALEARLLPLQADLDIDAQSLVDAAARITYICSPNNPTGNLASAAAMDHVVERAHGIVILDEAYADFARRPSVTHALNSGRVLVVRTLSKAYGLAGLRIGFAVGAEELVLEVEKSRGPYKVNRLAEEAATAAIASDQDWVQEKVLEVIGNRDRLSHELRRLGLTPLPSDANFVLVGVRNAHAVSEKMRANGVAVRPFAGLPMIGDALRISVGPWDMMAEALQALEDSLP
jgi:histidinol-phosphate aminotransferase